MEPNSMSAPHLTKFRDRLAEVLEAARRSGRLSEREYDALLLDPDFDPAEFEQFRDEAGRAGIELPEEAPEATGAPETRGLAGEPERDLLDLYLNEIGRIALLGHEQLLALARRSRSGDQEARKRIILANLRLVVHVARAYRNRGLPLLDLIEEGNLGLIQAVDRFEPERGLRFSTYASIWIRQSILRGIAEQAKSLRIPVQMFQQVNRYARAERVLRNRLGRDAEMGEIAAELKISVARAERLSGLIAGLRSLDEGSGIAAFEQLSSEDLDDAPPSVERLVELQLEHEKLDRLLRQLSQREEQILRIRYGFYDGVARTLAQTGAHFGISRERVRQIEARALDKLRRALEYQEIERAAGASVH
jgi:RNA polymerase primary sigma factor